MDIRYHSTRGKEEYITSSQAIIQGLAPDGGLYVPETMPKLEKTLEELSFMNYQQVAYEVMKLFLTDFTEEELKECIQKAYTEEKFDDEEIVKLVEMGGTYYLELFHGSTIAFKDMALSILPYFMLTAAKKNKIKEEIVILTATSGDTGKAALAGFAGVEGTKIIVFYPKDGVSTIQERQMITQTGENVHVIGIQGNFDDAQAGVKAIFHDTELNAKLKKHGYCFSSANSINIGRLIPQVVYYVFAFTRLMPECANFVVPTGNFGNILAAYYAMQIGLPIHRLICASNENKVLYDFFETGIYNRNREFLLTSSPSMDIVVSSNLERLIYEIAGEQTGELMKSLSEHGTYQVTEEMRRKLADFYGGFATEKECREEIKELFDKEQYMMDPHTAVASAVCRTYRKKTRDTTDTIVVSTASPYKFGRCVLEAIGQDTEGMEDAKMVQKLEEISMVKLPKAVSDVLNAEILHQEICSKTEFQKVVQDILKID